ncbi:MAG TPA: DNA-deoxyinosine glycosylase [Candidatus Onthousia faecigallinarum]|nr:DNA-deoxyinosine glycosylase [Candidatus Onthousia faecigallinarum]
MKKETIIHPLQPIYTEDSLILILGSLPSKKSREENFYYANPKNRFWSVLSQIFQETPKTKEEKITFLKKHRLALWDVIHSCDIKGSSDASICNVKANNISSLIKKTKIKYIIATGQTAKKYYDKFLLPKTKIEAIVLPSTSPANAKVKEDELIKKYKVIKDLLERGNL